MASHGTFKYIQVSIKYASDHKSLAPPVHGVDEAAHNVKYTRASGDRHGSALPQKPNPLLMGTGDGDQLTSFESVCINIDVPPRRSGSARVCMARHSGPCREYEAVCYESAKTLTLIRLSGLRSIAFRAFPTLESRCGIGPPKLLSGVM